MRLGTHKGAAALFAGLILGASMPAGGSIVTYSDLTTFVNETGATAEPPIPNLGNVGSATVGSLTFDGDIWYGSFTWSTLIPGNDLAINAAENFDIKVNANNPLSAIGFHVHEPTNPAFIHIDSCDAPCFDTTFGISLFRGSNLIGSTNYSPPNNVLAFFGVASTDPFDHVEVRDLTNTSDDEYFGSFYSSFEAFSLPPPAIPIPAALPLFATALGGLGVVGWWRRRRARRVGRT